MCQLTGHKSECAVRCGHNCRLTQQCIAHIVRCILFCRALHFRQNRVRRRNKEGWCIHESKGEGTWATAVGE